MLFPLVGFLGVQEPMENSAANPSAALQSGVPSVGKLSPSLRVLHVNWEGYSPNINTLAFPHASSLPRTQQFVPAAEPAGHAASLNNSMLAPAPVPLYSQNLWAFPGFSHSGASNLQPAMGGPALPVNCANGYGLMQYQPNGFSNQHENQLIGAAAANYVPQGKTGLYYGTTSGPSPTVVTVNQPSSNNIGSYSSPLLMMATSHEGSIALQEKLKLKDPNTTAMILKEGLPHIFCLMSDKNGCHVFIKLIEACNQYQLSMIVNNLRRNQELFVNSSLDRVSSQAVKRLIKVLKNFPSLIPVVTGILGSEFKKLMEHPTGFYVIIECIDVLEPEHNAVLYEKAEKHCTDLAKHKRGCIAINTFINRSRSEKRNEILQEIADNAVGLSQDASGNYVVQNVLDLDNPRFTGRICNKLEENYIRLSKMECGSHVMEKCIKSREMHKVVAALVSSNQLFDVAHDRYGNYVIQTALRVTKQERSPLHQKLLQKLLRYGTSLDIGYARNIINLIAKGIPLNKP